MVVAPQHVYSAIVKNKTQHDLNVTATYTLPNNGEDIFEVVIPAGGLVALPQKLVTEGSCTFTGHITHLSVKSETMSVELKGPYNVSSPVKDYPFVIAATETGLLISEGSLE